MEIFFCDICNESVPAGDLDTGRAYRRGERVVCAPCDQAMSGGGASYGAPVPAPLAAAGTPTQSATLAPPAAPALTSVSAPASASAPPAQGQPPAVAAPSQGAAGGILAAFLVLVFGVAGFVLMLDRLEAVQRDTATRLDAISRDFGRIDSDIGNQERRLEASQGAAEQRQRAERSEALAALQSELRELGASLEANAERFTAIQSELQALRTDQAAGLADVGARVDELGGTLAGFDGDIRANRQGLVDLETSLRELLAGQVAQPAAGSGEIDPDGGTPPWEGLLADLAHANPGLRLDAVYALGETKDSRVVPHLVPMLEDDDLFVRMATTHVLVDLDAKLSVPNLIDTLDDDSSPVREAAMVALRDLTGQDFGFDPLATEAQRKKRVDDWRDWWKRNGDDFLTGSA